MNSDKASDEATATKATQENEQQPKQRRRRRIQALIPPNNNLGEDELLMKAFFDIAQLKADAGAFDSFQDGDKSDLDGIKKVLRPGFYWGCAFAAAQFVLLRKVPKWHMNRSLSTRTSILHGVKGNPHYDSARKQKNPLFPRIKTHRDGSTTFQEGLLSASFTTAMDLSLSLLGGGVVWYYMTDKQDLFQAVSSIPLKSGESKVSDVLCKDFLQKDAEIPKQLWKEHTDDAVQNLRRFIDNCQRRHVFTEQLRVEQGLRATDEVTIPPPGVPPDLPIEEKKEKEKGLLDWAAEGDYWGDDDSDWDDEDEDGFWSSSGSK